LGPPADEPPFVGFVQAQTPRDVDWVAEKLLQRESVTRSPSPPFSGPTSTLQKPWRHTLRCQETIAGGRYTPFPEPPSPDSLAEQPPRKRWPPTSPHCNEKGGVGAHPGTFPRLLDASLPFDESLLDALTAVSSSGLAYFYYFVETIIAAAAEAGLDADLARALVVETFEGAAAVLKATGADPAALRAKVTSAARRSAEITDGFRARLAKAE